MNGWVSFNGGTNNSRPTGTVATYSCSNGFFLDGATSSICQTDGSWNSTVPNCGCKIVTARDLQANIIIMHTQFVCKLVLSPQILHQ